MFTYHWIQPPGSVDSNLFYETDFVKWATDLFESTQDLCSVKNKELIPWVVTDFFFAITARLHSAFVAPLSTMKFCNLAFYSGYLFLLCGSIDILQNVHMANMLIS